MSKVINLHFLVTRIKSDRWEVSVEAVHIHQSEIVILGEIFTPWFSLCDLPSAIPLISQMLFYLKATHEIFVWIWAIRVMDPVWFHTGEVVWKDMNSNYTFGPNLNLRTVTLYTKKNKNNCWELLQNCAHVAMLLDGCRAGLLNSQIHPKLSVLLIKSTTHLWSECSDQTL